MTFTAGSQRSCRGNVHPGRGSSHELLKEGKLNPQSLTKMELVGADMYMPEMLWTLYFIQSQGYNLETIQLYQDNKSMHLLMNNGQFSSGKKTNHNRAKFFFIKDRIDSRDTRVVHCPTEKMWTNMLVKAFRVMQSNIMNCSKEYNDSETNDENSAQTKNAEKRCKASPVTGRISLQAPT
jgi:hypothetical protein